MILSRHKIIQGNAEIEVISHKYKHEKEKSFTFIFPYSLLLFFVNLRSYDFVGVGR